MVTLTYMDRRGAGVMMRIPGAEAVKKIKTLRCEASIHVNGVKERVGGVDKMDYADDRRVKWNWWYDPKILVCEEKS